MAESHVYAHLVLAALHPFGPSTPDLSGAHELRCMLLRPGAVTDQAAHEYVADVRALETAGAGYTAGGMPMTGIALMLDGLRATLLADPVQWPRATLSAGVAVIYDHDSGSNDATRRLVGYVDALGPFGPVASSNATFAIEWADGAALWWDVT